MEKKTMALPAEGTETTLNLALIHHPVVNKRNELIGSAVTNLDLHDIARAAKTYGVAKYFITTPYQDQHLLLRELLAHWQTGHGAKSNPARQQALAIVRLALSLEEVVRSLTEEYRVAPLIVATSAVPRQKTISYRDLAGKIAGKTPVLLLFGTAHGLAPEVIAQADTSLPPISGGTAYNHLSVRSAASIIIDRLLGS
jgi:hypothetical protein